LVTPQQFFHRLRWRFPLVKQRVDLVDNWRVDLKFMRALMGALSGWDSFGNCPDRGSDFVQRTTLGQLFASAAISAVLTKAGRDKISGAA
jgi:hypothetical protein